MKDLSIIIVSYNTVGITKKAILSVLKYTKGISFEVLLVDNNSKDNTVDEIKKMTELYDNIKLIANKTNLGFGGANNLGIKASNGRYILLLNSDVLINEKILPPILKWMDKNPKMGIFSCALKNKDGTQQGTGGYFPTLSRVLVWMTIQDLPFIDSLVKPFHPFHQHSFLKGEGFYSKAKELDWVTGAFLIMRREVYEDIGLFDPEYFMYTEETDYCYRAKKAGWKVYYNPSWSVTHLGGASGKAWSYVIPELEGVKLFFKKHYPAWQFPVLRLFLKLGTIWRAILFGILKGPVPAKTYAKAFFTI